MRLFLRYQTSVQREYDKAKTEYKRAQVEREQRAFEAAALAQVRQNMEATTSGFASQNSDAELEDTESYSETLENQAAVRAAEAEGIGQRVFDLASARD